MNRKLIICLSFLLCFCLTPTAGLTAQKEGDQRFQEISNQIADVKQDVKRNTDDIAIIRRDETNYSIEKNILEKTYASNNEVVGKAVGFSFAALGIVFSIVSAMGMKGVRELAREYEKKLESAQTLKIGLESGLALLDGTRKLVETEFMKKLEILEGEISNLRNNQNSKVQVLELTEKAGLRFPRFFVFHQVGFMLHAFPDFAHWPSVPSAESVIDSQASNAVACDYKILRCIQSLRPSFLHA